MSRPGSIEARELFNRPVIEAACLDDWNWYRSSSCYDSCVSHVNSMKIGKAKGSDRSASNFTELDHWMYYEYPTIVRSRDPPHLTVKELSTVMKWKLLRGKARPLQALVDSNNPKQVISSSTSAFHHMKESDWKKAFDFVTQLKGIGEATASAILSPLYPGTVAFMADEVIEATCPTRKYDRKTYTLMLTQLESKSEELRSRSGNVWSVDDVGKALWTCAMTAAYSLPRDMPEAQEVTDETLKIIEVSSKKRKQHEKHDVPDKKPKRGK